MKIETVKLTKLVPDDRNARLHNERNIAEIARSLQELGQHRPFVVQKGTNRVIVGNGMLQAALSLGWTEGFVLWLDDDNLSAIRRGIADNRTAELAEWDEDVLHELLEEIDSEGLGVPGYTPEEIDELIDESLNSLPAIIDNSHLKDDRGSKTASGKGAMVVSIGKMSALFDYDKTTALCDAIREKHGDDDREAMAHVCEELYEKYCHPCG